MVVLDGLHRGPPWTDGFFQSQRRTAQTPGVVRTRTGLVIVGRALQASASRQESSA